MKLKIDELINERGIKRNFIASKLGVDRGTVRNWCENKTIPKLDDAARLAKLLRVKVDDLFEDDED